MEHMDQIWYLRESYEIALTFTIITITRLYSFDPLKSHFYTVKLGFTGVYFNFLISAQNIDCGYSLEPPRRGEIWKIPEVFIFGGKILNIFE